MPQQNYFSAAYPEPVMILGVRLRPFSLGHYLKLQHFDCAFVSEKEASASLGDLLLGVSVASMSSDPDPSKDEFWSWWNRVPSKWDCRVAKLFGKKLLTPSEREIIKWGKRVGHFNFKEQAMLFMEYITKQSEPPAYWELNTSESKSGAHWAHSVLAGLVSECGYTQADAYNVPITKALADYFKAAEDSGAIRLMTNEELEVVNGA
jgi:hypothetical protein